MKTLLTFLCKDTPIESIDDIAKSALNMGAHLHVLTIGLVTLAPISIYTERPDFDWLQRHSNVINETNQKAIKLDRHLKQIGISFTVTSVSEVIGSIPSVAAQYALFADYAVVPFFDDDRNDNDTKKMFIEGVMFQGHIPTILMPEGIAISRTIEQAVIGWHPSANIAIQSNL